MSPSEMPTLRDIKVPDVDPGEESAELPARPPQRDRLLVDNWREQRVADLARRPPASPQPSAAARRETRRLRRLP
jgi:hypothetical protein